MALKHESSRRRILPRAIAAVIIASLSSGFFLMDSAGATSYGPDASSSSCTTNTCNSNFLNSVSCSSSRFCVAVGAYRTSSRAVEPIIEQESGSTWTLVRSPEPPSGESQLNSVSCVSRTFCIAVGQDAAPSHGWRKITEAWNGKRWKIVDATPMTMARLQGVSCLSVVRCTAVGYYAHGSGPFGTLIELNAHVVLRRYRQAGPSETHVLLTKAANGNPIHQFDAG